MKTIIFGGSFDPIHNGHIQIAKTALKAINADKVVFLIAKNPRWKDKRTDDIHRLNMVNLAIKDNPKFELSKLELESSSSVNYTYDTILKYPKEENEELFFLIGYDQLGQLNKWYEIDKLSRLVKFIVYTRPEYELNLTNLEKYNCLLINGELSTMSSTKLRELKDVDAPKEVLNYIVENDLYYIPKIKSYINQKRFNHSVSVASLAYHIAMNNSLNASKAYIAGLLHDIGKYVDFALQEVVAKKYEGLYYDDIPRVLHHQYMSVEIARNEFGIEDEEILDAIKYHATGASNMSKLARIIYASDKIDPSRGYYSQDMINECLKDIDSGFNYVLSENIKYFKLKNMEYKNPLTIQCIKYYLGDKYLD